MAQVTEQLQQSSTQQEDFNARESRRNAVTMWMGRIKAAQKRQKEAFDEMHSSQRFAAGLQWSGQKKRNDGRYQANFTLKAVNDKVATLYAKNPLAEYQRRKRLDFQIYDGKLESIVPLVQAAMSNPMGLAALPLPARALLMDFQHGLEERERIDRVGKTLEIVFQYILDEQDDESGDFKQQMKQLVRRVIISKVGYLRIAFVRDGDASVTSSGVANTIMGKAKQVAYLAKKMTDGSVDQSSAKAETMKSLALGLGGTLEERMEHGDIKERVVFDCLPSDSVLVDPNCKQLKEFVGCQWIAICYRLPVIDVNAMFEVNLSPDAVKKSSNVNDQNSATSQERKKTEQEDISIYEIFDKRSRTTFFVCEGHDDYLVEPEVLDPALRGFWPLRALTFNDVEPNEEKGISVFPPSDVELLMSAQKEWNRTREELKKHRRASSPGWMARKGVLTENDKTGLQNCATNQVVELEGVAPNEDVSKVFVPKPKQPIDPEVYDVSPLMQDVLVSTGSSPIPQANVRPRVTATGQTIEAQKEMTLASSNVDDLDDLLTWAAGSAGQIVLMKFSPETVIQVAGPGASFPTMQQDRQQFLNQIYLVTKAASSGRPNKTIELRNWQLMAPTLMQLGANPQFMVRETIRRLDDNLDPEQAFPLAPMAMSSAMQLPQGGQHQPSEQGQHEQGITPPPDQNRPGPGQISQQPNAGARK